MAIVLSKVAEDGNSVI